MDLLAMSDRDWVSLGLQFVTMAVLGGVAGGTWRGYKVVSVACLFAVVAVGVLGYMVRQ